jgi:hypothetical protein
VCMLAIDMRTAPIHPKPFLPLPVSCLLLLLLSSAACLQPTYMTSLLLSSFPCPTHTCTYNFYLMFSCLQVAQPAPVRAQASYTSPIGSFCLSERADGSGLVGLQVLHLHVVCSASCVPHAISLFCLLWDPKHRCDMFLQNVRRHSLHYARYILETELFTISPIPNIPHVICDNIHISKHYRLHPVVCIIFYGYDHLPSPTSGSRSVGIVRLWTTSHGV